VWWVLLQSLWGEAGKIREVTFLKGSCKGAENWGEQACMVEGNSISMCDCHGNMGCRCTSWVGKVDCPEAGC